MTNESIRPGTEAGGAARPPRRRRREARPGEILDAAFEEFGRNGYAATRLVDVAARAGISHGTIYNYFPDKEALFRAVFRARLVAPLVAPPPGLGRPAGTAAERLRLGLHMAFRQLAASDLPALVRVLLVEGQRFPDLARACWDEVFGTAEALLRAEIDRGLADGSLRPGPWRDHPRPLLAPGLLAVLTGPLSGEPDWLDRAEREIDAFLDALMTGLATDAG